MATPQKSGSFTYPITGVRTGYDNVKKKWPARKEIDEFMKDEKQAVLFITAYNILQARPMDHSLSFFQLGGIHGLPRRPWPRQGGPGSGSYCEHSNPGGRFATWHRVYLMLFEQAMHEIIMELVDPKTPEDKSPVPSAERNNWRKAAETWRLPYWDFALRRPNNTFNNVNHICLPDAALYEGNPLKGNSGSNNPTIPAPLTPISSENPLYSFKYPLKPGEKLSDYGITDITRDGIRVVPLSIQTRTVRHAVAWREQDAKVMQTWIKGEGDLKAIKSEFQEQTTDVRKDLRSNLKETTTFPEFTMGTLPRGARLRFPDLSSVHGLIHVTTGGWTTDGRNGNMSHVPAAGLDPIFFLYHCAIDRIIAMWQGGHPDTRNPNNWLPSADDASPLLPFLDPTGRNYWVSKDTRDLTKLGYTYDVLDEIKDHDSLEVVVDKLYSDERLFRRPQPPARGAPPSRGFRGNRPEVPLTPPDWIFTAFFKISEIGAFGLKILLNYEDKTHQLGAIINFVSPPDVDCESCQQHREDETTTYSSTYISPKLRSLYEEGILESFDSQDIEELLKKGLTWELHSLENPTEVIPLERLTSLKVSVSRRDKEPRSAPSAPPRGGTEAPQRTLPSFRSPARTVNLTPIQSITAGKPGGLGEEEEF